MGKYIEEYFKKELDSEKERLRCLKIWYKIIETNKYNSEMIEKQYKIFREDCKFLYGSDSKENWEKYIQQTLNPMQEKIKRIQEVIQESDKITDEEFLHKYNEMEKMKKLLVINKNDTIVKKEIEIQKLIKFLEEKIKEERNKNARK